MKDDEEQTTIVFDLGQFGLANMVRALSAPLWRTLFPYLRPVDSTTSSTTHAQDYGFIKFLVETFEAHYPERLGLCLVVSSPWIFWGCWKIIQPWLPAKTKAKVVFVNRDKACCLGPEVYKRLSLDPRFLSTPSLTRVSSPAGVAAYAVKDCLFLACVGI
jgi:CRAL/TRIO-like protein